MVSQLLTGGLSGLFLVSAVEVIGCINLSQLVWSEALDADARHALRINEVIDNQVRSLRVRQVIGSYEAGERDGAYWGIRTGIADYGLSNALPCPLSQTTVLAQTKTRLKRLDSVVQERLINWGYAICDAAMRRRVDTTLPAPGGFPFLASKVG
jgi:NTE family protein